MRRFLYSLITFFCLTELHAQTDTISITLPQAEQRFVDSNLSILAAHYNADASKALIIQAKYWDNPVLVTDQVVSANHNLFPYKKLPDGSSGEQYFIEVQQLIRTAGKRGKLIAAAQTNATINNLQLQDVIRKLRSQLHIDYYTIARQLRSYNFFTLAKQQLDTLVAGMQAQFNTGNISEKDFLQLQSLSVSLLQDLSALNNSIADEEADIKTLLHLNANVFVKPADTLQPRLSLPENLDVFINQAKQNNPYYQLQKEQTIYQQQELTYQKALRTPDITLTPNFDKQSNYAPDYYGIGFSLPLPVFNKNKGNIQAAGYAVKQQQALESNAETELINNVENAYRKINFLIQQNNAVQPGFYSKFDTLYNNMIKSYRQRQISLLEFISFFNDYRDLQERSLQQNLNLLLATDELNYQIGIDVIK